MKTFKQFQEQYCCKECDDSYYGIVEEDFEVMGDEEYEDWGELDEGEGIVTPRKKLGPPAAGTYAADLSSGKFAKYGFTKSGKETAAKKRERMSKQGVTEEADKSRVKLGKPFLTPGGPKKRAVYVKNDKGNVVKVSFGDPNLEIKRDDPARRKNFRARHNCDQPGPRWKAKYWSCKYWSKTPVSKLD
jgi:hypothetical protein